MRHTARKADKLLVLAASDNALCISCHEKLRPVNGARRVIRIRSTRRFPATCSVRPSATWEPMRGHETRWRACHAINCTMVLPRRSCWGHVVQQQTLPALPSRPGSVAGTLHDLRRTAPTTRNSMGQSVEMPGHAAPVILRTNPLDRRLLPRGIRPANAWPAMRKVAWRRARARRISTILMMSPGQSAGRAFFPIASGKTIPSAPSCPATRATIRTMRPAQNFCARRRTNYAARATPSRSRLWPVPMISRDGPRSATGWARRLRKRANADSATTCILETGRRSGLPRKPLPPTPPYVRAVP